MNFDDLNKLNLGRTKGGGSVAIPTTSSVISQFT